MPRQTNQQWRIVDFIRGYVADHGYPPSVREIAAGVGLRSTASVARHLKALEAAGHISHPPLKRRAWTVEPALASPTLRVPLVGKITAGLPILAIEQQEDMLTLPAMLFRRRPDYVLRVVGDSMVEAGIEDGDMVAVQSTTMADNGAIVIALLGDEATVKYLERLPDTIRLLPANPRYAPIEDPGIQVLGVVVGLVRSY
ncbi:MAG: transcriptional repressor LexA [Thermaerobacter sp.]|nr:transcriptional repressor LexA [Thermaerobacter sp.]